MDTQEENKQPEAPVRRRFSLKLKEEEIEIEDHKGDIHTFKMKALDGTARDAYLTSLSTRLREGPDGKRTVQNFDGLQANLLSRCLYGPDGQNVPVSVIQTWPGPTIAELFKMSKDFSGLDEDAEKKAKNVSGASA